MRSPLNTLIFRGDDPTGNGHYGAKRGTRKHKGVDLVSVHGEDVFCPLDGVITKLGQVYSETKKFKYIEISNDVYRVRLMYCFPKDIKVNQRVFECDIIGISQDISGYWNTKMKNHIHMQIWKHGLLTDAEPLLKLSI